MIKIALVMPYYGVFPNYFDLWINSARYNSAIDFLIVTDSTLPFITPPNNIKLINLSLQDIKSRIEKEVGFRVCLDSPYKLCDYKPAYGVIFEDILGGYSHWGYCDSDIIFGDLSRFLTEERLYKYDRIYDLGHLCVYTNNPINNRRWKTKDNLHTYTYTEVFRVKHCKMFDERGGMWDIWKENGFLEFVNREEIADIFTSPFNFSTWFSRDMQWYEFNHGHLIGHFADKRGKEFKREFAYIHLQKRKMEKSISSIDNFAIVPNKFIDIGEQQFRYESKTEKNSQDMPKRSNFSRLRVSLKFDELCFHFKVALRRTKYFILGKNKGIKYKYF